MLENFQQQLRLHPHFELVCQTLLTDNRAAIYGLKGAATSFWIAMIAQRLAKSCLIIVPEEYISIIQGDLEELTDWLILCYPSRGVGIYDDFIPDHHQELERLHTLYHLTDHQEPMLVLSTATAILEKTLPPEIFRNYSVDLKKGENVDFEFLSELLHELGYNRTDWVRQSGEYAIRGGLIDLFPPHENSPVRVVFDADSIESLRYFDEQTQRSTSDLHFLKLYPCHEIIFDEGFVDKLSQRLIESDGHRHETLYARLTEKFKSNDIFPGIHKYLALYYPQLSAFHQYLPPNTPVFWLNAPLIEKEWNDHYERLFQQYESKTKLDPFLSSVEQMVLSFKTVRDQLILNPNVYLHDYSLAGTPSAIQHAVYAIGPMAGNLAHFSERVQLYSRQGYRQMLLCDNEGQMTRLRELTSDLDNMLELEVGNLSRGFRDSNLKWVVYTDHELFSRLTRPKSRRRLHDLQNRIDLPTLSVDDYVVHVDYGIGQFKGLKRITLQDSAYDCLYIQYWGDDKIYLPVDQINRIEKYSNKDILPPVIHKLGNSQWIKTREKTRQAIMEMAQELLELYAIRKTRPGYQFAADDWRQKEMETSFIYDETDGQLKALQDVKRDMEALYPMDRLICGDVGFGKTEVAIRAAFKAVASGKQVAVLVPTTILAQQHHTTFSERLAPFKLKIGMVSRFVPEKEQKQLLAALKANELDIIIGTHRLLSGDLKFHDLGLLIIDEEQRFGVKQKERIKRFRSAVDVLALSATPIPRTLNLSLMGARDISVIETPPRQRLAIHTEVIYFDYDTIRDAILREIHRGGQVFFVHNRIQTLYELVPLLKEIVPGICLGVAHGQMDSVILEDVMMKFLNKEIDLLLATMIIENGLDIPNVNTILIDLAERMGLAQLYQLRGRVGRSNLQAYAYLIVPPVDQLTPEAIRRIEAIKEFTELGSGLALAMRDMEIRGIGNVLGPQQHGFVTSIGYELYCRMLDETVRAVQGNPETQIRLPEIQVKLAAYLDSSYINIDLLRVHFYQRLYKIRKREELVELEDELCDRFGKLPLTASNLLLKAQLALSARYLLFDKISIQPERIRGIYSPERIPRQEVLIRILAATPVPVVVKSSDIYALDFTLRNVKDLITMMRRAIEMFDQIYSRLELEAE